MPTFICGTCRFPGKCTNVSPGEILPPPESNSGIARITIEQAKNLDGSKSMVGALDPYAILLLNGKEIHQTNKLKHTNNPVFSDNTKSVLITDRKKARVGLVIKDNRDLSADPVLGNYQIKIDDMLKLVDNGQEWFTLHGTSTGAQAKLLLDWKPVALKGAIGSAGYITPVGVMRVHIQSASNLRNFETMGKSDPYARVLLSSQPKGRTVTFQNNLNPTWDEVIYVPIHTPQERLILEVMDEEKLGKDRSLGLVQIAAADYLKDADEGGYLVHDTKTVQSEGLRMGGAGEAKGTVQFTVSFYPTLNVSDPEEEEEERKAQAAMEAGVGTPTTPSHNRSKNSSVEIRSSVDTKRLSMDNRKSLESAGKIRSVSNDAPSVNESITSVKKQAPKVKITAEELNQYGKNAFARNALKLIFYTESGLIVFNIIEGSFSQSDVQLEVFLDDNAFASYTSGKIRSREFQFGETGDAMVREIDMSRITLRLVSKVDKTGKNDEDDIVAKLTGPTLLTLQQCLYKPTELTIRSNNGGVNKVKVNLKYLPVKMQLDPSESINNMGTLRVDVMDAAELPAADRNGFSDPYCKFRLNGKEIYKTKTQKKTLHPAWNEFFEVSVPSRTAADFKVDVYDWDFGDKADFLGAAVLNLQVLEPFQPQELSYTLDGKSGVLRLRMLFKPDYVQRSRQGSSTFSGTFAPAGKVVGAPVKGIGKVGGGVVKGASFIRHGFSRGKGSKDESPSVNGAMDSPDGSIGAVVTPTKATPFIDNANTPTTPASPSPMASHMRTKSNQSTVTAARGPESGTASLTIVSAAGYPAKADVQVLVKMVGPKGVKEVYKTKAVKAASGNVEFAENQESFKVSCSGDTQFQVQVKDHDLFKSKDLGEAMFFVSDQGAGSDQTITVGSGTVTIRSSYAASNGVASDGLLRPTTSGRDSPDSKREGRRSFFGRRDFSGKHE
jgi:Ca2+-dependent lipid-binding protein